MGSMLVNDIKIIFELYQPVGVKQLSDQPVAASGFRGKKPFFETKKDVYYNTAIQAGTRYYYRVRGYVEYEGEKLYTSYSKKAWRTVL